MYLSPWILLFCLSSQALAGFDSEGWDKAEEFLWPLTAGLVQDIAIQLAQAADMNHYADAYFATSMAYELATRIPSKNVVVYQDPDSVYNFTNTFHFHHEVNHTNGHNTKGFDIHVFNEGTFHRAGDGGFVNWAFVGNFTRDSDRDLTFFPRNPWVAPFVAPTPYKDFESDMARFAARIVMTGPGTWTVSPPEQGGPLRIPPTTPQRYSVNATEWRVGEESELLDGVALVVCNSTTGPEKSHRVALYDHFEPGVAKTPNEIVEIGTGISENYAHWLVPEGAVKFPSGIKFHWDLDTSAMDLDLPVDATMGTADNGFWRYWVYKDEGKYLFANMDEQGIATSDCYSHYYAF